MEIKITLPFYFKKNKKTNRATMVGMNWYRNAIHFELNKQKKKYNKMVLELTRGQGITFDKKIGVSYRLFYKNDHSDNMNVVSVIDKFLLDALQDADIIEDDDVKHYTKTLAEVAGEDRNNPRLEVTITDNLLGMLKEAYLRELKKH